MRNSRARPYWVTEEQWGQTSLLLSFSGRWHHPPPHRPLHWAGAQQTLIRGSPFSQISKEILETGPLIFVQCLLSLHCDFRMKPTSVCYAGPSRVTTENDLSIKMLLRALRNKFSLCLSLDPTPISPYFFASPISMQPSFWNALELVKMLLFPYVPAPLSHQANKEIHN